MRRAPAAGFGATELNRLERLVQEHEQRLLKAWHEYFKSSGRAAEMARAMNVRVTNRALIVGLADGRTVSVPVSWYPRLAHGSLKERHDWRLIGPGIGIHWPALDEDIFVEGLLDGVPSGESRESFERWLASRSKADKSSPLSKPRRASSKK